MFKGENKYYILIGIVFLLVISSAYYFFNTETNKPVETGEEQELANTVNEKQIVTVEVAVPELENKAVYEYEVESEEKTAYAVLYELNEDTTTDFTAEFDGFEMEGETSYFITSLMGYTPDSSKEFWKFFVNGEESSVGISSYVVKADDLLLFEVDEINM